MNAARLHLFLESVEKQLYGRLARSTTSSDITKGYDVVVGQIDADLMRLHFEHQDGVVFSQETECIKVNGDRVHVPVYSFRFKLRDYEKSIGMPALISYDWQAIEDVAENNGQVLSSALIRYIDITFRVNSTTSLVYVDYTILQK
eukprot:gene9135-10714_t